MQVLRFLMAATRLRCALAWLGRLMPASRATVRAANVRPAQRLSGAR